MLKQHLPVQCPEQLLALYLGRELFCQALVLEGRNALKRMAELE